MEKPNGGLPTTPINIRLWLAGRIFCRQAGLLGAGKRQKLSSRAETKLEDKQEMAGP
jgi:hypothetical protein